MSVLEVGEQTAEAKATHRLPLGHRVVATLESARSILNADHVADVVLSRGAEDPIPFRVSLDGEAPDLSHGVDVDEDGNGVLQEPRMYQLIRQHDAIRERTVQITFRAPGAEAYSFTFG